MPYLVSKASRMSSKPKGLYPQTPKNALILIKQAIDKLGEQAAIETQVGTYSFRSTTKPGFKTDREQLRFEA